MLRRCIYLLVKYSNKGTLIKNQPKENGENPIISPYAVKLQSYEQLFFIEHL